MEFLYTVEEKYLQATEELNYGELPKALHLFHEIVNVEPTYARAHYQLGCFYHYQFKDYQTAGYHYKNCISLEPMFPDVHEHYLKLVITLEMHKLIYPVADRALQVFGVCKATIYESLGSYEERRFNLAAASIQYKKALQAADSQDDHRLFCEHLKRITEKQHANKAVIYAYQEG